MKIVKVGKPSRMEVRHQVERLEPKARGRINISKDRDFIFPDDEIVPEWRDDMPRSSSYIEDIGDFLRRRNAMVKKVPVIGKYQYEPPSILQARETDKKVERTGKLVYDAEPTTQEKAMKKYIHYANKYKIPITTKERGKKTIAELAKDINTYEHNPKNMARILKQPIDAKYKERGLYLIDV